MVDPLSYFSFQPVLHDYRGMCYPVSGMVHIKERLLLIGKSSPCGESIITVNKNVLTASLNKTFPSFFRLIY